MSKNIILHPDTRFVLNLLEDRFELRPLRRFYLNEIHNQEVSLSMLKEWLLMADAQLAEIDIKMINPIFNSDSLEDWGWITYVEDIDVIPIYEEGLILSISKPIIQPAEIPNLVRFITAIPGQGVVLDDHGFGNHFHYGFINNHKLDRTDLLLTFNPKDVQPSNATLYAEKHGKGRYIPIDFQTIGNNKRRPIYEVCLSEMTNAGIKSFKVPAKKAEVFYS